MQFSIKSVNSMVLKYAILKQGIVLVVVLKCIVSFSNILLIDFKTVGN